MKLNKLFLMGAIALGLVACNTNEIPDEVSNNATNSYASVTVKFPKGSTVRALPGDYNQNGTWTGRDAIETVTVFLVNTVAGVVDYNSFAKSSFEEIDVNGVLKPNLALKATAGENIRVYTVINGEAGILATLKATPAGSFATAFAAEAEKIASEVASFANGKETIMMTNDADNYEITVAPGVTENDAIAGTNNHVQVNVERVVARAILTVEPTTTEGWPVNAKIAGVETQIATVTDVQYAVGQSNKKFFIMKKADYTTPDPVYSYVPNDAAEWATNTNFDYSGLTDFTAPLNWAYDATNVSQPLNNEGTSKFVLPVTHAVDKATPAEQRDSYKKGNTTYFEIRASFMPLLVDGVAPTFTVPTTVFLGANDNKFYSTRALAEAQGQKATEFKDGIMKYVLWLNPNSLVATVAEPNPMVSPTVRNQVYHAHVSEFLRMGVPNNPLDPNDPNDPANPDNPIDPTDPLKTDVTYLSVSVKVLPWTIHTYKYSLTDGETMY